MVLVGARLLSNDIWANAEMVSCRHLGNAGEAAVHLLSRLLAFDPARRCPAEEALSHEYLASFENLDANMGMPPVPLTMLACHLPSHALSIPV